MEKMKKWDFEMIGLVVVVLVLGFWLPFLFVFCRGGAGIFTSTLNILGKYICMVYGCTVDCTDKEKLWH